MTQITLNIKDSKLGFFLELIRNFEFIKMEQTDDFEFTEVYKAILDQRLENQKNNLDSYHDWEEVQKDIEKRL